ncbi:hypothetical protein [Magnetospirillum fulvum]|uniref:RiboL-PSP-HEPN domain-containing protein n=1 Tax=Magnetospirillum fulvum TaxID=1082 RepID=A0A1H6H5S4_MAGFU|nr:hypothetical protein [Magnetospirillum fulvum]SEH31081.1 hypothetical protein SAMN04244559_01063 [Magnetospirillum fulvum]
MNEITEIEDKKIFPIQPSNGQLCSEQCFRFIKRHADIFGFLFFSTQLAAKVDETRLVAARALAATGEEKYVQMLRDVEKDKQKQINKYRKYAQLQTENMCINLVDNFICFLSGTVQACMRKRPELLKSSEMIRLEDVLRLTNYRELVSFLVDKKINELIYGGFKEIETFLMDRSGLSLTTSDAERSLVIISIELRNIYTHNRGVVNDIFLKRTKGIQHKYNFKHGHVYCTNLDELSEFANNMYVIAMRIDQAVSKKFRVARKKYNTWGKT